jgi:hypothetical protein
MSTCPGSGERRSNFLVCPAEVHTRTVKLQCYIDVAVSVRCRMFSPISGNYLDVDVDTKEMVDAEYGWRRDLQRACMCAGGSVCSEKQQRRRLCSAALALTISPEYFAAVHGWEVHEDNKMDVCNVANCLPAPWLHHLFV